MSQYYKVVNLDKKQFFSPEIFNDGVKLGAVMNGIHPYVIGRLLLANLDSGKPIEKFRIGYWSGDKIAIVGDESRNEFTSQLQEFENVGAELFFSFINDENFQELILNQLKTDNQYYARIGFLVHQCADQAEILKRFLIRNFGKDWEKKAKEVWQNKKTTFIELSV
ncbi:hypothetical protein [Aquimarina litoralis]|uniref:hypothetical protein n=1 Tax=Aquimarina litoralis TaxID=584605 RepID=UPI001C55DE57|nr:hypothetical protein [Aquimarina litoralis]MBW1294057.1 hypothetical protein [Aquimarina litoralis]